MTTRMALRQREQPNTMLGGKFHNQEGGLGRIPGKAKPNSTTARSALVNISNKSTANTANTNVTLKDAVLKARSGLPKATGTSSLKSVVDKENPVAAPEPVKNKEEAIKDELRKLEPCKEVASPMDTSSQQIQAYSKQLLPDTVTNIDKDDSENPQLVSEYVNDIYDYMHELERRYNVKHKFLEGQEINGRMRAILYDWLVQVHLRFHLLQETLYLTTAIIDRFLQIQKVSKNKLQLVGVTAMLIASKYEEMYAPEIADFVYITDNAYSKADIRSMECVILRSLDFNLGRPLPLHFLRRNSKAGDVDTNHHTMAKYLMELTLIDYDMVHFHPSEIAAAALCLSMKLYDGEESSWSDTLKFYSKYSEEHLMPVMQRMALLVTKAGRGKCTAIKTKYSSAKFMRISAAPQLKNDLITDLAAAVPAL